MIDLTEEENVGKMGEGNVSNSHNSSEEAVVLIHSSSNETSTGD